MGLIANSTRACNKWLLFKFVVFSVVELRISALYWWDFVCVVNSQVFFSTTGHKHGKGRKIWKIVFEQTATALHEWLYSNQA